MSMVFIASSGTLTSTTASVSFLSVTQSFTHLQLRCFFKSAYSVAEGGLYVTPLFSNVGGGSGRFHNVSGNGSSAQSSSASAYYTGVSSPVNSGTTSIFASAVIDILDYTNTNKYKTIRTVGGFDANGAGIVGLGSMFRFDLLNAINGFVIDDSGGGGWLAGTRFDLYGITSSQVTGA